MRRSLGTRSEVRPQDWGWCQTRRTQGAVAGARNVSNGLGGGSCPEGCLGPGVDLPVGEMPPGRGTGRAVRPHRAPRPRAAPRGRAAGSECVSAPSLRLPSRRDTSAGAGWLPPSAGPWVGHPEPSGGSTTTFRDGLIGKEPAWGNDDGRRPTSVSSSHSPSSPQICADRLLPRRNRRRANGPPTSRGRGREGERDRNPGIPTVPTPCPEGYCSIWSGAPKR